MKIQLRLEPKDLFILESALRLKVRFHEKQLEEPALHGIPQDDWEEANRQLLTETRAVMGVVLAKFESFKKRYLV